MKQIEYYLDFMELLDGAVVVRGWAADRSGGEVQFQIRDKEKEELLPIRLRRLERIDVAQSVLKVTGEELKDSKKCALGFELRFSITGAENYELIMTAGNAAERIRISLKKLKKRKEKSYLPWKKMCKMTTLSMLLGDGKALIKKGPSELKYRWERYETEESRYGKWLNRHLQYEQEPLNERPLFSLIVPAYQTPPAYLKEMIQSVRAQSYENWELCIADGSGNGSLCGVLEEAAASDKRIRYEVLEENRGISGNTNAALSMAKGTIIVLLDHDDIIARTALWELAAAFEKGADVVYTDEDKVSMDLKRHFEPHFKPDFNLDLLRSNNYICHLFAARRDVVQKAGEFRSEFDGSQDYDFILRCIEQAEHIVHLPRILYHWRSYPASTAADPESKDYCYEAGRHAVETHLKRMGIHALVSRKKKPGYYRVTYPVNGNPLVSILIPNKDEKDTLKTCLESIYKNTSEPDFEIIIIENNSEKQETFDYYHVLEQKHENLSVIRWEGAFHYSAINNFGAKYAKGDFFLLLNNDTEVLHEDWLSELVSVCQRPEVGICGAKLFYPDGTIQHAGVIMKITGTCCHAFLGMDGREWGRYGRAMCEQDYSAVTGACMLIKRKVFEEIGGLSEAYQVAYNDVDFCLKARRLGYLVVWNPDVKLYHYESKSRGYETTPEKKARFEKERERLKADWPDYMQKGDPYYNPNLTLTAPDFSIQYERMS